MLAFPIKHILIIVLASYKWGQFLQVCVEGWGQLSYEGQDQLTLAGVIGAIPRATKGGVGSPVREASSSPDQ